jgi:hypothetical protein
MRFIHLKADAVSLRQIDTMMQPNSKPTPTRRRWFRVALAVVVVVGGAGAALYWWQHT